MMAASWEDNESITGRSTLCLSFFLDESSVAFVVLFVALGLKELYLRKANSTPLFADRQPCHGLLASISSISCFLEVIISSDSSDSGTDNGE